MATTEQTAKNAVLKIITVQKKVITYSNLVSMFQKYCAIHLSHAHQRYLQKHRLARARRLPENHRQRPTKLPWKDSWEFCLRWTGLASGDQEGADDCGESQHWLEKVDSGSRAATADRGGDLVEDSRDVHAERCNGYEADDGDQGDHQAVLNHRGSIFLLVEILNPGDKTCHHWSSASVGISMFARSEAHRVDHMTTQIRGFRLALFGSAEKHVQCRSVREKFLGRSRSRRKAFNRR